MCNLTVPADLLGGYGKKIVLPGSGCHAVRLGGTDEAVMPDQVPAVMPLPHKFLRTFFEHRIPEFLFRQPFQIGVNCLGLLEGRTRRPRAPTHLVDRLESLGCRRKTTSTLWHRAGNVADGVSTLKIRVMEYVYGFRGKARQGSVRVRLLRLNDGVYTKISRYFTSSETGMMPCFCRQLKYMLSPAFKRYSASPSVIFISPSIT